MTRSLGSVVILILVFTNVGCRTCNNDRYRLSSRDRCDLPPARPTLAAAPRPAPAMQPTYSARPCDNCPTVNASPLPGYGSPTYPTVGGSPFPPGGGYAFPQNFNVLPYPGQNGFPGSAGDPSAPPALIPATPVPTTPMSINGLPAPIPLPGPTFQR